MAIDVSLNERTVAVKVLSRVLWVDAQVLPFAETPSISIPFPWIFNSVVRAGKHPRKRETSPEDGHAILNWVWRPPRCSFSRL